MRSSSPFIFLLLAILHIAALFFDWPLLRVSTKPLLMPALAWWFWQNTPSLPRSLRNGWLAGLGLSTIGDMLLIGKGTGYFAAGLGAFLAAHLVYIFVTQRNFRPTLEFLREYPMWIAPFAVFLAGFLYLLWPGLPCVLRFPVAFYGLVLTIMALNMVNLEGSVSASAYRFLVIGSLLFMLSDTMIAWNTFVQPFPSAALCIMGSYLSGQGLMARGIMESPVNSA
jgi:uncharacterized membrane protein YhhN